MDSRVKIANEKHEQGYNCAQAVACTYCDLFGMDENTVFQLMEGFGLGMGGMEQTCGAITGAIALAGMKNSEGKDTPVTKAATYKLSREILAAFAEKNHTTICGELKGVQTGEVLRSCPGCIADAAQIVEQVLFASGDEK